MSLKYILLCCLLCVAFANSYTTVKIQIELIRVVNDTIYVSFNNTITALYLNGTVAARMYVPGHVDSFDVTPDNMQVFAVSDDRLYIFYEKSYIMKYKILSKCTVNYVPFHRRILLTCSHLDIKKHISATIVNYVDEAGDFFSSYVVPHYLWRIAVSPSGAIVTSSLPLWGLHREDMDPYVVVFNVDGVKSRYDASHFGSINTLSVNDTVAYLVGSYRNVTVYSIVEGLPLSYLMIEASTVISNLAIYKDNLVYLRRNVSWGLVYVQIADAYGRDISSLKYNPQYAWTHTPFVGVGYDGTVIASVGHEIAIWH